MEWEEKKIETIFKLNYGKNLPKRNRKSGEYPVYSSAGEIDRHTEPLINSEGVIIGRKGSVGTIYFSKTPFFPIDTTFYIKPSEQYDLLFIYYCLKTINLDKLNSDAAVPGLNRNNAYNQKIKLPPLPTQQKIASILRAYDDLIENNLKRIQLLEEAAQNLYKEWFVNFRFPGHEQAVFDEETGLPEGWEKIPYSETAEFINGYAFKPRHHFNKGLPIIKIKELKNGVDNSTPRNDGKDIKDIYFIDNGDILFSWSAYLDTYWWSNGKALLNQHLFKVIPNQNYDREFFYFCLKASMPDFRNRANGATMKHIKRKELENVLFTNPSNNLQADFSKIARNYLNKIVNLKNQNQQLQEARDLLLPRLMNQDLDV